MSAITDIRSRRHPRDKLGAAPERPNNILLSHRKAGKSGGRLESICAIPRMTKFIREIRHQHGIIAIRVHPIAPLKTYRESQPA